MNGLVFLVIGVALSALIIPLAMRMAPLVGMVDEPDPRKVHAKPIPRIGGIGITIGALLPVIVLMPWDTLLQSFIVGALVLFVFGALDDARELTHWIKFAGQFFAAGLVVYYGGLWVERFPFLAGDTLPPSIGKPFTVFAIVGVINAINHSDGLDGLAGGESLLGLIVMGFLAYAADDAFAVYLTCAVAGGILGFLRYNTHPAKIFMGDAGSQFLGFTMAFLAVYLTQVAHPALSPALPLLLIGLPIADINAVFYLRISGGMNWFKATRNHIHHRLLDLGFEHYETVIIIYLIQACLVIAAVVLRYQSDFLVTGVFLFVVTSVFIALTYAERRKLQFAVEPERRALGRVIGSLGTSGRMAKAIEKTAVVAFCVLLVTGAASVDTVQPLIAVIAGTLFVVCVVINGTTGQGADSIFFRFATNALALLVVYLTVASPPTTTWMSFVASTPAYLGLGLLLGIAIRLSTEQIFKTTATDYLIVLGLIVIIVFGRELFEVRKLSLLIIHSVVMIYASEYVCRVSGAKVSIVMLSVLLALGILVASAF